jgi:PD-(D/E)XK nuclease superfamily
VGKQKRRIGTSLSERDCEVWKLFAEDVLSLAEAEESASVVDLFRMDLFRKRPQLYEVWVVVAVLRFMRTAGYKVEMLTLLTTRTGRIVWNLNYAKSQAPIARLVRASDGSERFLFYQLFRPGERRDEMPDIALMPSRLQGDKPVWIMDPKHSERGAYSFSDYAEVGMRYQSAFSPLRTWIVEFYPRPELGVDNPLAIAEGVELIRDGSPDGAGYKYLVNELRELHGSAVQTVAIPA